MLTHTLAASSAPAGGAAMGQVIGMTVGLSIAFTALVMLGERHRRGGRTPLGTVAAFAERVSGLPAWSALPLAVAGISLAGAVFGYMWDVSWHIDKGRDIGPLANPSHYLILAGLYGAIASGYLTTVLTKPGEKPGRSAIRLAPGWEVPLGGALIGAAAVFAFIGFPLDDMWHRMFGQDVTLWGPTHLIMLGGGMLTLVGVALLFEEGVACSPRRAARARSNGQAPRRRRPTPLARLADLLPNVPVWPTRALIAGGFLAGLSIFQGEFDYGVPQFELVLQPLMIAASAGIALVCARIWVGRGGALGAVGFYLLIRVVVSLLVGPVFGRTEPALPLYVPEALCVELVALGLVRRPLAFGALAGLAAGTVGLAGEWAWVNAVMPIDWTSALLPEGPIIAAVGGVAGGTIGALFGLSLRRRLPRGRLAGGLGAASLAVIMLCFAFGLADRNPSGTAQITLTQTAPPPQREVMATVRLDPPRIADGANWVRGIAWQGGGLVGFQLDKVADGVYHTPSPLPVHGDWKAGIRIQNGHSVIGSEIYAPADAAIPVGQIPAVPRFTRPLRPDREILQRERKRDVAPWLWTAAAFTVLALSLAFLALLAASLGRFSNGPRERQPKATTPPRVPAVTGAG